ncbi:MAG: helix-hairpin-helix domain-containing protein [Carboxylicivirga sp.]|jgi:Fanconi anemia group M protein|nr:helix-hairpin-helix domain-containing protein [Carboxylicivirga sp.]
MLPTIIFDHREEASALPDLLIKVGFNIKKSTLKCGDYLLENSLLIERKTCNDFALSIIQDRLFKQCLQLKNSPYNSVIMVEGNPYKTNHKIDREAIKGALLSISGIWHIPIIYSASKNDSAQQLFTLAYQHIKSHRGASRKGYKPKSSHKKQLYFLQGLPNIGSQLAIRLLDNFNSLEAIVNATVDELQMIEGIGKKKAERIREFLCRTISTKRL